MDQAKLKSAAYFALFNALGVRIKTPQA